VRLDRLFLSSSVATILETTPASAIPGTHLTFGNRAIPDTIMPPHLVFGGGGIGGTEKGFIYRWDTPEKVSELLDALRRLGIVEIDAGASYPPQNPWNTETLLGQSKAAEKGFIIDSKIAAHVQGPRLNDSAIQASVDRSLELLGTSKVRTMYAHAPDSGTPLEETAAAFHRQYMAGKFERVSEPVPTWTWISLIKSESLVSATTPPPIWRSISPSARRMHTLSLLCTRGFTTPSHEGLSRRCYPCFENTVAHTTVTGMSYNILGRRLRTGTLAQSVD
jgi:hypothetical protein